MSNCLFRGIALGFCFSEVHSNVSVNHWMFFLHRYKTKDSPLVCWSIDCGNWVLFHHHCWHSRHCFSDITSKMADCGHFVTYPKLPYRVQSSMSHDHSSQLSIFTLIHGPVFCVFLCICLWVCLSGYSSSSGPKTSRLTTEDQHDPI